MYRIDRYYQIARCFRDEDLRADRQPEFTQIDCEMAFVSQEDILNTFEDLVKHLFQKVKNIKLDKFPVMTYDDAVHKYGTDKPDLRYDMKFVELNDLAKNGDFNVFNNSELVVGFMIKGGNSFTRKDIDKYTDWVKRPQIGAGGLAYLRIQEDGTYKSSVDKFYDQSDLENWANKAAAKQGDILFILSVVLRFISFSCSSETVDGESIITSLPELFLGNAMKSRIISFPPIIATSLSSPNAIPP